MTEKRADAAQGEVSEKFVKAISKAALEAMKTVVNVADEADQSDIVDNLIRQSGRYFCGSGGGSRNRRMHLRVWHPRHRPCWSTTSTFLKDTQNRTDGDLDSLGNIEGSD